MSDEDQSSIKGIPLVRIGDQWLFLINWRKDDSKNNKLFYYYYIQVFYKKESSTDRGI